MGELRVGGITPLTTIDYPGELAAVIFCQGCPWRCRYCHNQDLLPPRGKTLISWHKVLEFLKQRSGLLDAVVFSGGEATLQAELNTAIQQTQALGFKIGLHSAGIYPRRLATLFPLLDWVGLDIKALPSSYAEITNIQNSGIPAWESAQLLIDSGIDYEIRITLDPLLIQRGETAEITARLRTMGAKNIVEQPCLSTEQFDATTHIATSKNVQR